MNLAQKALVAGDIYPRSRRHVLDIRRYEEESHFSYVANLLFFKCKKAPPNAALDIGDTIRALEQSALCTVGVMTANAEFEKSRSRLIIKIPEWSFTEIVSELDLTENRFLEDMAKERLSMRQANTSFIVHRTAANRLRTNFHFRLVRVNYIEQFGDKTIIFEFSFQGGSLLSGTVEVIWEIYKPEWEQEDL